MVCATLFCLLFHFLSCDMPLQCRDVFETMVLTQMMDWFKKIYGIPMKKDLLIQNWLKRKCQVRYNFLVCHMLLRCFKLFHYCTLLADINSKDAFDLESLLVDPDNDRLFETSTAAKLNAALDQLAR